jgi:hypothetical protein
MNEARMFCLNCRTCDFWENPEFKKAYKCKKNDKTVFVYQVSRRFDNKKITSITLGDKKEIEQQKEEDKKQGR